MKWIYNKCGTAKTPLPFLMLHWQSQEQHNLRRVLQFFFFFLFCFVLLGFFSLVLCRISKRRKSSTFNVERNDTGKAFNNTAGLIIQNENQFSAFQRTKHIPITYFLPPLPLSLSHSLSFPYSIIINQWKCHLFEKYKQIFHYQLDGKWSFPWNINDRSSEQY